MVSSSRWLLLYAWIMVSVKTARWSQRGDQCRPVGKAGERVEENTTWGISNERRNLEILVVVIVHVKVVVEEIQEKVTEVDWVVNVMLWWGLACGDHRN